MHAISHFGDVPNRHPFYGGMFSMSLFATAMSTVMPPVLSSCSTCYEEPLTTNDVIGIVIFAAISIAFLMASGLKLREFMKLEDAMFADGPASVVVTDGAGKESIVHVDRIGRNKTSISKVVDGREVTFPVVKGMKQRVCPVCYISITFRWYLLYDLDKTRDQVDTEWQDEKVGITCKQCKCMAAAQKRLVERGKAATIKPAIWNGIINDGIPTIPAPETRGLRVV
jgi:hypothetical protein